MQLHEDDCLVSVEGSGSESTFVREVIRSALVVFAFLFVIFINFSRVIRDFNCCSIMSNLSPCVLVWMMTSRRFLFALGQKLVASGLFEADMLSELLDEYSQFNLFDRFGDFLSIRFILPSVVIDFLVNPSFIVG